MNTLYDFIVHVKGIEYLIGLGFIAGYILFWEVLKPKPFQSVATAGKQEMAYIKETGRGEVWKSVGRVAAAPFIGLSYIIALPFVFAYALMSAAVNGVLSLVGSEASFGWRPTEAYLAGKKKKKEATETKKEEKE